MQEGTVKLSAQENLTVIDGVYVLKCKLGQGGMATVFLAEVDQLRFDYTLLYAYTQVQGASHLERRRKAEALAGQLRGQTLDPGTVRTLLMAQGIPVPGTQVALKVATGEADAARFEVEWKSLLCLNHPHVVQVYGGGTHLGRPYYAMELLERIITPQRLKDEFTIAQRLQVIIQAARGLGYLHANGIVHRDVKPDNIVVCETLPGEFAAKITDLGIAKQLEMDGMTLTRTAMGTPHYMSPEQIASSKDVDPRADVYSLGATLYELLSGVRPYHDKTTVFDLFRAISLHTPPTPVAQHNPALPDAVVGIIECAMAWDPDCRYQKMDELIRDIEKYLADEDVNVTRATAFGADSRARSAAHIGKGKYAFERYRRKAHMRAGLQQARAGAGAAAGSAAASAPAAVAPGAPAPAAGRARKPLSPLLVGGAIAALVAVVAVVLVGVQMARRATPQRPAVAKTAPAQAPAAKPPTVKSPPPLPPPQVGKVPTTAEELHAALKAKNPEYNGKGEFTIEDARIVKVALKGRGLRDLTPLRGLPVTSMALEHFPGMDLAPLAALPLKEMSLSCQRQGDPPSLAFLRGTPADTLSLSGCSRVPDFAPLAGRQWHKVYLLSPPDTCADLTPLRGLRAQYVYLIKAPGVVDLAPLRDVQCQWLHINDIGARDFSTLAGAGMEILCIENGRLDSLAFVAKLPQLRELQLLACPDVKDLRLLAGAQIQNLAIEDCAGVSDLAGLEGLAGLSKLQVRKCPGVTDLRPVAGLKLTFLSFEPFTVTHGIGEIRGMKTLTDLSPGDTRRYPAAEFWTKYDAGEFGKPGEAPKAPVGAAAPAKAPTTAEELHAALKARNPEYSGDAGIVVEQDRIVEVDFGVSRGTVTDYTPLRGLPLRFLQACGLQEPEIVAGMATLRELRVVPNRVKDWSALRGAPLESLTLGASGSAEVEDFGFLTGMKLRRLHLKPATQFDPALLHGMPLAGLFLGNWPGDDLSQLRDLPLVALELEDCPHLADLAWAKGLRLSKLVLSNLPHLRSLNGVEGMPLSYLYLTGVPCLDLSPLRGLPLKSFGIENALGAEGWDVSPLADSPLSTLSLGRGRASSFRSLEALRKMRTLESVRIEGTTYPTAEFWKRYDAGEFGKPGAAAVPATTTPPPAGKVPTTAAELHAALKAKNPEYDGKAKITVDPKGSITELVLKGTGVKDLSPVRGLPLVWLDCSNEFVTDLAPLRGLPLRTLRLSNTPAWDLAPLAGMQLEGFSYVQSAVDAPDAGERVLDLDVLAGMPLREFRVGTNGQPDVMRAKDFRFLAGMELRLANIEVAGPLDLSLLRGMPLESLALGFWQGEDLAPLGGLPLKTLNLALCPNIKDLTPLRGFRLQRLTLSYLPRLSDLSGLAGMQVASLQVSACPVSDISPLRGLPLESVNLSGLNGLKDLSPLADSPVKTLTLGMVRVDAFRGWDSLRKVKTLATVGIGGTVLPAAEFWKRYDAGEFGKPGPAAKP